MANQPRNITTPADLEDLGRYIVAYGARGLNGHHMGVPWKDGVCGPISGYQAATLFGSAPIQAWEYHPEAKIRWTDAGACYELPSSPADKPAKKTSTTKRRAAAKK